MNADRKMVEWMLGQLPELQRQDVIGTDAARSLREHYEARLAAAPRAVSLALAVCGVLGATLVGLGVILLVAHNWEMLDRVQRVTVSFLPTFAGLALAGWTLRLRPGSAAWREGSAVFLMAGVGATISLVSQTYHIMPDMAGFLLVWMALTGPLAYLLGSNMAAAFFWIGMLFFAGYVNNRHDPMALLFWPMTAAMIPRLWLTRRAKPGGGWDIFLSWTLALALCVAPVLMLAGVFHRIWILVYSGIFGVMCVAAHWRGREDGFWRSPLRIVGAAGVAILAVSFSFEDFWDGFHDWGGWYNPHYHWVMAAQDYVLGFGIQALALALLAVNLRRRRFDLAGAGMFPALALCAFLAAPHGNMPILLALFFNFYLFGWALWFIVWGVRSGRLARMNGGLTFMTMLVIARFFDGDWSALTRGVAFILAGGGFLIANVLMLRRKEAEK